MKRIHMHWPASAYRASEAALRHYHYIVEGDGSIVEGRFPVEANRKPQKGKYAAHTLNANTGAIGIAVCGMHGAKERPFNPGKYPLTSVGVTAMVRKVARLCKQYDIPVTRETVLTHAEVQPTLGIRQRAKWDITWLPGMEKPGDPVEVGDVLRARICQQMRASCLELPVSKPKVSILQLLFNLVSGGSK